MVTTLTSTNFFADILGYSLVMLQKSTQLNKGNPHLMHGSKLLGNSGNRL